MKIAGAVAHITGRIAYRDKTAGPFVYVLPLRDDIEVREIEGEGSVIFYRGERMTRQLHEWLTRGVQYTRSVAPVVEGHGLLEVRAHSLSRPGEWRPGTATVPLHVG